MWLGSTLPGPWPAAATSIQPLAQELPYATGMAVKMKKIKILGTYSLQIVGKRRFFNHALKCMPHRMEPRAVSQEAWILVLSLRDLDQNFLDHSFLVCQRES